MGIPLKLKMKLPIQNGGVEQLVGVNPNKFFC